LVNSSAFSDKTKRGFEPVIVPLNNQEYRINPQRSGFNEVIVQ